MREFKKVSRWVSEIEDTIKAMHQQRAATEARISKKINRIMLDAVGSEFWLPQDKVSLCAQLNRMATVLEADDTSIQTLSYVENEVDKLHHSHVARQGSASDLAEMEELTTYHPEEHVEQLGSVVPVQDFEGVRKLVEKKSAWSDFAETKDEEEDALDALA